MIQNDSTSILSTFQNLSGARRALPAPQPQAPPATSRRISGCWHVSANSRSHGRYTRQASRCLIAHAVAYSRHKRCTRAFVFRATLLASAQYGRAYGLARGRCRVISFRRARYALLGFSPFTFSLSFSPSLSLSLSPFLFLSPYTPPSLSISRFMFTCFSAASLSRYGCILHTQECRLCVVPHAMRQAKLSHRHQRQIQSVSPIRPSCRLAFRIQTLCAYAPTEITAGWPLLVARSSVAVESQDASTRCIIFARASTRPSSRNSSPTATCASFVCLASKSRQRTMDRCRLQETALAARPVTRTLRLHPFSPLQSHRVCSFP